MRPEVKAWLKATLPSVDTEALSDVEVKNLEADYDGRQGTRKPPLKVTLEDGIESRRVDAERVQAITDIALQKCEQRPFDIDAIKSLAEQAIEGKWTVDKFRLELLEATLPKEHTVFSARPDRRISNKVLEAALCMTGRLEGHEKMFDDQTLQTAHDEFRRGIGLNQLILVCAEANGYNTKHSREVTVEAQRAAFGMLTPTKIQATQFSTINISTILSNVANKYLREGWMAVDQTPMNIAAIRPVRDFKQITTVSLTGDLRFRELSATGEIQHGTVGEETYNNQADTYARMLAITRQDIFNDDVSALTSAPRRLGRGGMLQLNNIFWSVFLNNAAFFTAPRNNLLAGTALGLAGLGTAEVAFMSQTDPDGLPLGVQPSILLVPTALHATALTLMTSEKVKGATDAPDANIWRGRFNVESSPYMHNTAYTGASATAWYLLANPAEMPVIEIAALNGNVMPVVETADADFNVLGIQMRGYSDVGVALQEYRGGVRAIA